VGFVLVRSVLWDLFCRFRFSGFVSYDLFEMYVSYDLIRRIRFIGLAPYAGILYPFRASLFLTFGLVNSKERPERAKYLNTGHRPVTEHRPVTTPCIPVNY